jgi:peroxiredoxin
LADFAENQEEFMDSSINLLAASVDDMDKALEMVNKHGIEFPVGCNLDPVAFTGLTGAFYDEEGGFLHAAGFIIDPDGKIVNAVYSTGPLGRLRAENCLAKIKWEMSQR